MASDSSAESVARLLIEKYAGLAWAKAAEVAAAHGSAGNSNEHQRWRKVMQAIEILMKPRG
jgi:hypothetical protein